MRGISLILAAVFSISLSSFSARAALPTNDELKIGITQEFENLNPLIATMVASTYMVAMVTRTAVYLDAKGVWSPQLMKSIPTIENKQAKFTGTGDNRGIVTNWEVLENAKWGDGTPVTCEDFKFSWQVGLNENVSVGSREPYQNIEKFDIDSKNPKKCSVTFKKAKYDFFQNLPRPLPKHLEEAVLTKFGSQKEGYDQNSNYTKDPTNKGLYNGPYMVTEIKLGSHVVFGVNPHFYGQKPAIKKIIIKYFPNTSTLEANLMSGTIDMISTLGMSFDQAIAFEEKVQKENLPYKVNFQPSATYEHIDLDLENPILKDMNVRKAIVHAINRDLISRSLFKGKQPAAVHNIAPLDPNFTNDPAKVVLYKHDKKEAARLLEEAGWKLQGEYRFKNGEKLSLPFMTTAGNKTRESVQTMLKDQLKAVGIELVIKNEPARVFFGETMKERKFKGLAMYAWVALPDSSGRSTLHSSMIPRKEKSWSGQNYPGWINKTADTLIEQFESEFLAKKRKELTHKLLKEYTNEVPVVPLYYRTDIAVTPKNMTGFRLTGHMDHDSNEIEKWTLSK